MWVCSDTYFTGLAYQSRLLLLSVDDDAEPDGAPRHQSEDLPESGPFHVYSLVAFASVHGPAGQALLLRRLTDFVQIGISEHSAVRAALAEDLSFESGDLFALENGLLALSTLALELRDHPRRRFHEKVCPLEFFPSHSR